MLVLFGVCAGVVGMTAGLVLRSGTQTKTRTGGLPSACRLTTPRHSSNLIVASTRGRCGRLRALCYELVAS
jgi:hypothetical protein